MVEHMFLALCSERGFRQFSVTSAVSREQDKDLLLECYRHMPKDFCGWHYPDVKANLFSLLPGLKESKPLKPHQYMISKRFDDTDQISSGIPLSVLFDERANISTADRFLGMAEFFSVHVDETLALFRDEVILREILQGGEGAEMGLLLLGPANPSADPANSTNWNTFLKPL